MDSTYNIMNCFCEQLILALCNPRIQKTGTKKELNILEFLPYKIFTFLITTTLYSDKRQKVDFISRKKHNFNE